MFVFFICQIEFAIKIQVHIQNSYSSFHNTGKTINSIVGNGKRFLAYDLVAALEKQNQTTILKQLIDWVNKTQQSDNKQHEVFEPSFDWKECRTEKFIIQKLNTYIIIHVLQDYVRYLKNINIVLQGVI